MTKFLGKIVLALTNSLHLYKKEDAISIMQQIYMHDIQHITGRGNYDDYKDTILAAIKNNVVSCLTFMLHLKNICFSLKTRKLNADNKNFKRSLLLRNANIVLTVKDKKHHCNKFEYCLFLKNVVLDCQTIPAYTFRSCIRLKRVVLKNTQTICSNAFMNCISLETVCIPKTTRRICRNAFKNCVNLKKVVFY